MVLFQSFMVPVQLRIEVLVLFQLFKLDVVIFSVLLVDVGQGVFQILDLVLVVLFLELHLLDLSLKIVLKLAPIVHLLF
jgi:hypothetical protein